MGQAEELPIRSSSISATSIFLKDREKHDDSAYFVSKNVQRFRILRPLQNKTTSARAAADSLSNKFTFYATIRN